MLEQFNLSEASVSLDFEASCRAKSPPTVSAIDEFYAARDATLQRAIAEPFSSEPSLRHLLVLGLGSATEAYFRRLMAEVLDVCPRAREAAGAQMVPIGALESFGSSHLGMAIGDTKGVTSQGEIANRTKQILGIVIGSNTSLGVAISEFEQVCHLRHAIVHSAGEVLFNNRRELKISLSGRREVDLDLVAFDKVLQVMANVVRAYNNFLANKCIERWIVSGVLKRRWDRDRGKFTKLVSIFKSDVDSMPAGSPQLVYQKFLTAIPATSAS